MKISFKRTFQLKMLILINQINREHSFTQKSHKVNCEHDAHHRLVLKKLRKYERITD